ncbi:hypothetical protein ACHAO9_000564 [Fusarium lateritium]
MGSLIGGLFGHMRERTVLCAGIEVRPAYQSLFANTPWSPQTPLSQTLPVLKRCQFSNAAQAPRTPSLQTLPVLATV